MRKQWMIGILSLAVAVSSAWANERVFTYTYEPEVFPEGAAEWEQWVTLGAGRSKDVGQQNYNRWDIREEFEYGVTDNYTASLYVNTQATSFRDPSTKQTESGFEFDGISIENRYMVLNPAETPVGLTLYLEPKFSGKEAELEQRIIIGQRHGDWKWALNLVHETEWELNDHQTEGVFEVDFGLGWMLNKRWSIGVEVRNQNEIPDYEVWENTAIFVGPVVSYRRENWWAAFSVLPQVWGQHLTGGTDPDGVHGLELEGHERINIRLIWGIGF